MNATFYQLGPPTFWGDYGLILVSGFPDFPEEPGGQLRLQRTGPFMPPITFPGSHIVVSEKFMRELKTSFPVMKFRNVIKHKIVEIHWETWDRQADPQQLPIGDPENYIFEGPHSQSAAEALGEVFELVLADGAACRAIDRQGCPPYEYDLVMKSGSWNGEDIFMATSGRIPIVTEDARRWLENMALDWVTLKPLQVE